MADASLNSTEAVSRARRLALIAKDRVESLSQALEDLEAELQLAPRNSRGPGRLRFDEETYTVFLDNESFTIANPHAFRMYRAIAERAEPTITLAALRKQKALSLKGAKAIPRLKKALPETLRATMRSGHLGHWIVLPKNPHFDHTLTLPRPLIPAGNAA